MNPGPLIASGLVNGLGIMFFTIGKRRDQLLRMIWGAGLFALSFAVSDSLPLLLLGGALLSALAIWKPE